MEGLETLDYLDNCKKRERFTEQEDSITFESEVIFVTCFLTSIFSTFLWSGAYVVNSCNQVDRIYLSTPTKIKIMDHEKKRTFVIRKEGLPDAGETLSLFKTLFRLFI